MNLRQGKEGVFYVLGVPARGQGRSYSEVRVTRDEIGIGGEDSEIERFATLALAEQVASRISEQYGLPAEVYQVEITRVSGSRLRRDEVGQ